MTSCRRSSKPSRGEACLARVGSSPSPRPSPARGEGGTDVRRRGRFGWARMAAAALAAVLLLVGGPVPRVRAADGGPAWMDPSRPPAVRAEELLAAMTFDEKVDLVTADYAPLAHLGV